VTDFVGSGWAFPVGVDSTGQIALARGSHDIEQAMRLILMTYPGERPMRPSFGSKLRDFVFDGATWENAAAVAKEVHASLAQWEPRATVTDVMVIPEADVSGVLNIDIAYVIKGTNDPRNLVFPFYTIPEHEEEP
jgi:phage baseplate assembly protein W